MCLALNKGPAYINSAYIQRKERLEKLLGEDLDCDLTYVSPNFLLTDQFIVGLIDGDGSFHMTFNENAKIKYGLEISGERTQADLFKKIQKRLECGSIREEKGHNLLRYHVGKKDLIHKILAFMEPYPLYTIKKEYFSTIRTILLKYKFKR